MKNPEYHLQCNIYEMLKMVLKKNALMTCFPSGGGGKVRGARLKRMGLVPGWPDIQIIYQGKYYGIEVKTSKGVLSPNQKTLHDSLINQGAKVAVVKSVAEAVDQARGWGIVRQQQ